jgi:hypothetical protein
MRTICRAWCFLFGHKAFEPAGEVQAYHLCHYAREWNVAGFTAREFTGIVRWPFYCMWRCIRDFPEGFKAQFFRHQNALGCQDDESGYEIALVRCPPVFMASADRYLGMAEAIWLAKRHTSTSGTRAGHPV